MASTTVTTSDFLERHSSRAAPVEVEAGKRERARPEVPSTKTSAVAGEISASGGTDAKKLGIPELSNSQGHHREEGKASVKSSVATKQDAVVADDVPTVQVRCLPGFPTAQEKADVQDLEHFSSETSREPSASTVLYTIGSGRLKCSTGSCSIAKMKSSSSKGNLGDEVSSSRSDSRSIPAGDGEADVSDSSVDVPHLSVDTDGTTTTDKSHTYAVAATTAVDPEADATTTRKPMQRALQPNETDLLTPSLQTILQHRCNDVEQENWKMKEVVKSAANCNDGQTVTSEIQLLKEQLVARDHQHRAEKREFAATVKGVLTGPGREKEKEKTAFDPQHQNSQLEERGQHSEKKQNTIFCTEVKQDTSVNKGNDDKQLSRSPENHLLPMEANQGSHQQESQRPEERVFLPNDIHVTAEKRRALKAAFNVDSGQQGSFGEDTRIVPEYAKEKLTPGEPTVQAALKKNYLPAVDTTSRREASETVEIAGTEASINALTRCDHKGKPARDAEQPHQQLSKQLRQVTDAEKDGARRLKKTGSWWRQQVVNRLRLPGPNLTRKQFLSTFYHPETGVEEALLNSVFDRMKVILRPAGGAAEEVVTIPHVLDLLEKTNGANILHTLDAAELLEANVRCIDRKAASQKTDVQVFAMRLMCRFFLALSKKALGELEVTCKRAAPQEAVQSITEELDNYRLALIRAVAAEKNISVDRSTVIVSKCIHNMRTELQNDIALMGHSPSKGPASTHGKQLVVDVAGCPAPGLASQKPLSRASNGIRTFTPEFSSPVATVDPRRLAAPSSPLAGSVETPTLPSMYSYGTLRRLAVPGGPRLTDAELQAPRNPYIHAAPTRDNVATKAQRGAVTAGAQAAHNHAIGGRYGASILSSPEASLVGVASSSSAAAPIASLSSTASGARTTTVPSNESAGVQQESKISASKQPPPSGGNQEGQALKSESAGEAAFHQAKVKEPSDQIATPCMYEKSGGSAKKLPATTIATTAGVTAGSSTAAERLTHQRSPQKGKDLNNIVQIIEYRYADGTPVTNPAHLPEGAKAVEAAARARLEETARVAQEAARRAESAALEQFTAATAAGGGGAAAASVAAAQYQRAFAALNSNQGSGQNTGMLPKIIGEVAESNKANDPTKMQCGPSSKTLPSTISHDQQQSQQIAPQGQHTTWKPQNVLPQTAAGGFMRPLPAVMTTASAVRVPCAPQPANINGVVGEGGTTEGMITAQKAEEGACFQRAPSFRGSTPGEHAFPPTNRSVSLKECASTVDYNAAAGIVPPGFPPAAAGQLQALLQQQHLLTAMPSMVVATAKPTSAAYDTTTQTALATLGTAGGVPSTSRGRVSRSLTPQVTEKESFLRRSRGACGGRSPHRKSKRGSNSSRTASVSSIQRAAGRFFASLGLWKSDDEDDDEEDKSSSTEGALLGHDGLAEAAEQYLYTQQQKLLQQQQEEGFVSLQVPLPQSQQQQMQQQQQQLQWQQQLQQLHLQNQHMQQHHLHQSQLPQHSMQRLHLQQQLQQAKMVPGSSILFPGPPSRISTACDAPPAELLPKAVPADGATGKAATQSMCTGLQPQSLHQFVTSDGGAQQGPSDSSIYNTDTMTEKNVFSFYSTFHSQHQYSLAQQQKRQQEQQQQQMPQQQQLQQGPPGGEGWIYAPSFPVKDVPERLHAEQNGSLQQRAPEKTAAVASMATNGIEKGFTATVESILAVGKEGKDKGSISTAEKTAGYLVQQQKDYASVQLETQAHPQRSNSQQSYMTSTDVTEKEPTKQQLQQAFLQQQRGGIPGGYSQINSRDTSVVTTHIPQQMDSLSGLHAVPGTAHNTTENALQQAEGSQTVTSLKVACHETGASAARQQTKTPTATVSSSCAASGAGYSGAPPASAVPSSQARQQPELSEQFPSAFSTTGATALRTPQHPDISRTIAHSSCSGANNTPGLGAGLFPPPVVRTRVSSMAEVPSPQLGAQHIANFAQVQAQLGSLTQRQIEAYAQRYGLYPTPQAAAAALGGIPLVGVGALSGPATCNSYAQFLSQHRPLPPVPPNYVFTKSS